MALTSYKEVRPWANAIREAVVSRTMPPWHAAPGSAHVFRNDRSLSAAEVDTLVKWADGGSPEGEVIVAKARPTEDSKWRLGKPDRGDSGARTSRPKNRRSALYVPDRPAAFRPRYLGAGAAEFRIDQRAVVHHMNAFVREPGSSYLADFPRGEIFVPTVAERGRKRPGEALFARPSVIAWVRAWLCGDAMAGRRRETD